MLDLTMWQFLGIAGLLFCVFCAVLFFAVLILGSRYEKDEPPHG